MLAAKNKNAVPLEEGRVGDECITSPRRCLHEVTRRVAFAGLCVIKMDRWIDIGLQAW